MTQIPPDTVFPWARNSSMNNTARDIIKGDLLDDSMFALS